MADHCKHMAQIGQTALLFKSRANLLALLHTRGFNVADYEGSSVTEVHSMHQAKQLDMLVTQQEGGKKAYVKYHLAKTLRSPNLYEYIDDLFDLGRIDDFPGFRYRGKRS